MAKSIAIVVLGAALALTACRNDNDKVQAIRGDGPNSSLIRNPASADLPLDTNQLARIKFDEPVYDFGEAKEGDKLEHLYKFTNTGKVPLTILKARSSCGCTVPEWPREPIPPGGTGEIKATFDTEGRVGEARKAIYVLSNTYPNEIKLEFRGQVLE
jgi:hypothetical protein